MTVLLIKIGLVGVCVLLILLHPAMVDEVEVAGARLGGNSWTGLADGDDLWRWVGCGRPVVVLGDGPATWEGVSPARPFSSCGGRCSRLSQAERSNMLFNPMIVSTFATLSDTPQMRTAAP